MLQSVQAPQLWSSRPQKCPHSFSRSSRRKVAPSSGDLAQSTNPQAESLRLLRVWRAGSKSNLNPGSPLSWQRRCRDHSQCARHKQGNTKHEGASRRERRQAPRNPGGKPQTRPNQNESTKAHTESRACEVSTLRKPLSSKELCRESDPGVPLQQPGGGKGGWLGGECQRGAKTLTYIASFARMRPVDEEFVGDVIFL